MSKPESMLRASFGELAETVLRLALLALLLVWTFRIIAPFVDLLVWAAVLAVASRPLHVRLMRALGNRAGVAATFVAVGLLAVLVIPVVLFSLSVADGVQAVSEAIESGRLRMPSPDAAVARWPVVGEPLHRVLTELASNTSSLLERLGPQLKTFGLGAIGIVGSGGIAALGFVFAAIIAAMLLVHTESLLPSLRALSRRLVGERGEEFLALSTGTIRSVFKGVLGVAAIQSLLAAIGMFALGVPGAGLWALLVLILAIVQLPPLIVLGPMILWAFMSVGTLPAILFTAWSIVVSLSDNVLKVLLLGRGIRVPMLVILVGAIGGLLAAGILGLFIGPVVMALAYEVRTAWLAEQPEAAGAVPTPAVPSGPGAIEGAGPKGVSSTDPV
jgi:predicted PurR-regulated permease PerM